MSASPPEFGLDAMVWIRDQSIEFYASNDPTDPPDLTPWQGKVSTYNGQVCDDCYYWHMCGVGNHACDCRTDDGGSVTVCFDANGEQVGLPPGKQAVADLRAVISAAGAKLKPTGAWWVLKLKNGNRRVSGLATGPSGREYVMFIEFQGQLAHPTVVSSQIYRKQTAFLMRAVSAAAVK